MQFGLIRVVKFLSMHYLLLHLKKQAQLFHHRGKGLILGLNCNVKRSIIGESVFIGDNTTLNDSEIGNNSYISNDTRIRFTSIGKFCSIGAGVKMVLGNHPTNLISTHPTFYSNNKPFKTLSPKMYYEEYGKLTIGNDVWVGENVLIPNGITIGDGAVIAAGAVVIKNVEPYSIVGGVPAELIRYRFKPEEIEILMEE